MQAKYSLSAYPLGAVCERRLAATLYDDGNQYVIKDENGQTMPGFLKTLYDVYITAEDLINSPTTTSKWCYLKLTS